MPRAAPEEGQSIPTCKQLTETRLRGGVGEGELSLLSKLSAPEEGQSIPTCEQLTETRLRGGVGEGKLSLLSKLSNLVSLVALY